MYFSIIISFNKWKTFWYNIFFGFVITKKVFWLAWFDLKSAAQPVLTSWQGFLPIEYVSSFTPFLLLKDWDGDGPESKQWDTLQQKYSCCGVHNYTDWSGLYQFQDFAEHFNATAPHPVPCSCMPQFDLLADDMTCGLYYDKTVDDVPFFLGCNEHLADFTEFNLKLIGTSLTFPFILSRITLLNIRLLTGMNKQKHAQGFHHNDLPQSNI